MIRRKLYEYMVKWRVNKAFDKISVLNMCMISSNMSMMIITSENRLVTGVFWGMMLFISLVLSKHVLKLRKIDYLVPRSYVERRSDLIGTWICQGIIHSLLMVCVCGAAIVFKFAINPYCLLYMLITGIICMWIPNILPKVNGWTAFAMIMIMVFWLGLVHIDALNPSKKGYAFIFVAYLLLVTFIIPVFIENTRYTLRYIDEISDVRGRVDVKD